MSFCKVKYLLLLNGIKSTRQKGKHLPKAITFSKVSSWKLGKKTYSLTCFFTTTSSHQFVKFKSLLLIIRASISFFSRKKNNLPRQDSNLKSLIRSQMPYTLGHGATHSTLFLFIISCVTNNKLYSLKKKTMLSVLLAWQLFKLTSSKLFLV